jgi:hypothetical protein
MNAKQLACVLLILGIVVAVQVAQTLHQKAEVGHLQAQEADGELQKLRTQLKVEKELLQDLRDQSGELLGFVSLWEPYFAIIEEQEEAETSISMQVRKEEIASLSQRYQQTPHNINNKLNESLPILVQANLLFDDSYPKLINWVGQMERIRPTMRVGRVIMAGGSQGNAVRMELVLEVPLLNKKKQ